MQTLLNTSLFNLHLPLTLVFGHSILLLPFLICRVNSSGPGQGPTSYSVLFTPQHTELHLDQRHFQIRVTSAQLLSLVTAISKKNPLAAVYFTVLSTTLFTTILSYILFKNTEILKSAQIRHYLKFGTNPVDFNVFFTTRKRTVIMW